MKKYCVIKTTFKNLVEAKKVAKILLKNKLIACAQISTIESLYSWQDQIVEEKEFLLSLKTKIKFYKNVEEMIIQNHSYKVPQIIMIPIENGTQSYFDWMESWLANGS